MNLYPGVADLLRPVRCVAMPRAPRVGAPRGTMHVRCDEGTLRISDGGLESPESLQA